MGYHQQPTYLLFNPFTFVFFPKMREREKEGGRGREREGRRREGDREREREREDGQVHGSDHSKCKKVKALYMEHKFLAFKICAFQQTHPVLIPSHFLPVCLESEVRASLRVGVTMAVVLDRALASECPGRDAS